LPPAPALRALPQITISSASSVDEECSAAAAGDAIATSGNSLNGAAVINGEEGGAHTGGGGGGGEGSTLWTPEIPFENLTESELSLDGRGGPCGRSLEEELDNLMDISIEIASNKRMKKESINPIR
jgi:hypothetical protein